MLKIHAPMMDLIEQYIDKNHFGNFLGMHFNILSPGVVAYRLVIHEKHLATPSFAHGGVLTALIDACMGVGALSLVSEEWKVVSTLECKVSFLQAVRQGSELRAVSNVVRKGRSIVFMEAEVWRDDDLVAKGSGTFRVFSAEKAGYII